MDHEGVALLCDALSSFFSLGYQDKQFTNFLILTLGVLLIFFYFFTYAYARFCFLFSAQYTIKKE